MSPEVVLTLAIAVYGAGLSTWLAVREIRKDRRRILVVLEYASFFERAQIIITNVGHRPITITAIAMSVWEEQTDRPAVLMPVPQNALLATEFQNELGRLVPFPVTINDGDHVTLPLSSYVGERLTAHRMRASLTVFDIEGNEYREYTARHYNPKWGGYS